MFHNACTILVVCRLLHSKRNVVFNKVIREKAASPTYHPSWLQMDSSDLTPIYSHGSLDPHESARQTASQFTRFCTAYTCAEHTETQRHRHTHHATCERPSSVVSQSVCLSVGLSPSEPCRKFGSDRDTVCNQDSGGPRKTSVAYSGPI